MLAAAKGGAQRLAAEDCLEVMLQSRLSDGTKLQLLSATTAPLLLPLGVAGTTPSSMSEAPAQRNGPREPGIEHTSGTPA